VDIDEPTRELLFEGPHFSPLLTTNVTFRAEQIDNMKDDQIISTRDSSWR